MRPGGPPPGPVTRTLMRSQAAVMGAAAHPDLARVQARVAVQAEDAVHRGDAARRHDVQRAAGRLLGRLEDQPDPSGQQARGGLRGQEQARAQHEVVCTSCPHAWHAFGTVER